MADYAFRLRILVDNQGGDHLLGEHGFSVWIETAGQAVLFDTGQGDALAANAAVLGCELGRLNALVLSHGHYDHSGGVSRVLQTATAARAYCHAGAFVPRYRVCSGEVPRSLAVAAADKAALLGLPAQRLYLVAGPMRIAPGIGLSGPIPRRHPLEDTGGPFFLDPDGHRPDPLEDDLALWIETACGLVIVTGCCHAGLINTVAHLRAVSGRDEVCCIVGGLHLLNARSARLEATCSALRGWNPDVIVPCHCTGEVATARLRAELGEKVVAGAVGLELTMTAEGTLAITAYPQKGDRRP